MLSLFKCGIAGLVVIVCGCAQQQAKDMNTRPGEKALAAAWNMIGRPYQYTGEGPEGFDCSGLVRYSYLSVGMDVPHATSELKEATRGIDYEELRKGDLVFFDRNGKKYGHVGIYAGDDRFIHAPRPGKSVRIDSLHNTYWKQRFSGARRFN